MLLLRSLLATIRRLRYPGSSSYWERRYARGGDSGAGSSGVLAAYKASVLNDFVQKNAVQSLVELGCGDGRQLQLAGYPNYSGLDIAPSAVARCRELFVGDPTKRFAVYDPFHFDPAQYPAELAISLEVIFHLTEQEVYELYLRHLFACSKRWVVIFAADTDRPTPFPHFRLRRFTPDIARLAPAWRLLKREQNPHPDLSVSQFFVFEKNAER